jgi:hypothetical protein
LVACVASRKLKESHKLNVKEIVMPMVGNKSYSYTKAGMKKAEDAAKKKGLKVKNKKQKKK